VPILIQLLGSSHEKLRVDSVWTLSNIAFECGAHCGLAVSQGLVSALLLCAASQPTKQMMQAVANALNNIAGHCDCVESTRSALPWLASAAMCSDAEVVERVCWALAKIAAHCDKCAQAVLDTGVGARLLQLLSHGLSSARQAALEAVESICLHPECAEVMVWLDALRPLKRILADPGQDARLHACGALANIMRHGTEHVASVLDESTFAYLVDLLADYKVDVARAALDVISVAAASDAATVCKSRQRSRLIKRLSDLLTTANDSLRGAVTDCLHRLLHGTASSSGPERTLEPRIRDDAREFGLAAKLEQLPRDERNGKRSG
jgi:hypothetical protein